MIQPALIRVGTPSGGRARQRVAAVVARAGAGRPASHRGGFTIVDLLVSLGVISLLVSLMMPAIGRVRESTRQLICSSNVRQLGLATVLYADDNRQLLPPSIFAAKSPDDPSAAPARMMTLRIAGTSDWDGLGWLFSGGYAAASGVYYCPSHAGEHAASVYEPYWAGAPGQIVGNYQYRGGSPLGVTRIDRMPGTVSLVTDGLTSLSDYSHVTGANVMRADLAVLWFDDADGSVRALLAGEFAANADDRVSAAWQRIDGALSQAAPTGSPQAAIARVR